MSWLNEDIRHWASNVNWSPLCGSDPGEPMTQDSAEVTCLSCVALLGSAQKRSRR